MIDNTRGSSTAPSTTSSITADYWSDAVVGTEVRDHHRVVGEREPIHAKKVRIARCQSAPTRSPTPDTAQPGSRRACPSRVPEDATTERNQSGQPPRTRPAAFQPHMPWTPAPGGVDAEHNHSAGFGVAYDRKANVGRKISCIAAWAPPAISPPT